MEVEEDTSVICLYLFTVAGYYLTGLLFSYQELFRAFVKFVKNGRNVEANSISRPRASQSVQLF